MKTLYVTDLDGTLLNSNGEVSKYTVDVLNKLIAEGAHFTVATARTPATVVPLLKAIDINLPVIVMNGSFIYDIKSSKYIYTSQIPYKSVQEIISAAQKREKQIFVYTLQDDFLTVYHKGFNSKEEEQFCNQRSNLELKKFVNVDNYSISTETKVGHMVMIDTYEVISEIMKDIQSVEGIHPVMYRDVNTENSYLLEIATINTNKAKGIETLAAQINIDKVVSFGDNVNDKEMLEVADYGCVVQNAHEDIKTYADCIISSNDEDGVARFIKDDYREKTA